MANNDSTPTENQIPYGYCHCGCGQKTTIYGGRPRLFLTGHNMFKHPYRGGKARTCSGCGITKPLSEFYKEKRTSIGYQARCKACHLAQTKQMRMADPEKTREMSQQAYKRGRERQKAWTEQYNNAHAERLVAARRVNMAVRSGRIPSPKKLACAMCNHHAHDYHHHKGYDEQHQLDVIPLCRSCHRKAHL